MRQKGHGDAAIKFRELRVEGMLKLVGDLFARNQKEQALVWCNRAVELSPRSVRTLTVRGELHVFLGDAANALADFNRAIELNPRVVYGYVGRARALLGEGKLESAKADCTKAIELKSDEAEAYRLRAIVLATQGDHKACWDDVRKCRKYGGRFPDSFINGLKAKSGRSD